MPRFAANLSMMYTEVPFLDRFAAAAKDGFSSVEFLFPYDYPAQQLQSCLQDNGLSQITFNALPGDWSKGERGIACLPDRIEEFKRSIDQALTYAQVLGNKKLHVMAGITQSGFTLDEQRATYLANLNYCTQLAQQENITMLIEPINTRDMPGYLLTSQEQAQSICAELAAPNLQVLFDIYHCQIMEGDLSTNLKRDMYRPFGGIGHIQIASVPNRNEPNLGELNSDYLFKLIDELGYQGWIGCEYRPIGDTSAGLGWMPK
jgi:hydroxypyruvate isomerase